MADDVRSMRRRKRIALIAHDNRKADLLAWARFNRGMLERHELHATGTTGAPLASELGLPVARFLSGPLGGDQQVGAAIAEGRIDLIIFFWDPLEPHPRRRREGPAANRCRLQRPDRVQPRDCRLRALERAPRRGIPTDGQRALVPTKQWK